MITRFYSVLMWLFPLIVWAETPQEYLEYQQSEPRVEIDQQQREFALWRKQLAQDSATYKNRLLHDFEVYRRMLEEEYADYRRAISQVWDQVEVSGPKVWVEYSQDRLTKRVMDYERNEIRIHVVEQSGKDTKTVLEHALKDMLGERMATAVQREPVLSNVEKRLNDSGATVRAGEPGKQLVLQELFNTPKPTWQDVTTKAKELLVKGLVDEEVARAGTVVRPQEVRAMVIKIPLPMDRPLRKAKEYREVVRKHGRQWKINEALIMAVIHTESAFNPMATSYVPAYGMMQIVPKYAGMEVTEKLWGKPTLLAPSYLYNPDNNIMIGSVYLNLLYYVYFDGVIDTESRLLCAISAYNTGPGNVARAFTGKRNVSEALPIINAMTSREVFKKLRTELPYDETRTYVQRVAKRMKAYQAID